MTRSPRIILTALLAAFALTACGATPRSVPDAGEPTGGGEDAGATDAGGQGDAGIDAGTSTTLRVHYPAGTHALSLRGSAGPLNWGAGVAFTPNANDTWTYSTTAIVTAPRR